MNTAPAPFDREVSLSELLDAKSRNKLDAALTRSLGEHWQVVDADGKSALGNGPQPEGIVTHLLQLDIEVIGQLQASGVTAEVVAACATWLEMLLASTHRYRMAADLHLEAVSADYEALQRKHEALQQSEARYRGLNAELDQRVREQVGVIEHTQRRLYQVEKMAAVGSLAAGMAHEINNPIGFIRSNLSTAAGYLKKLQQVLTLTRNGKIDEANAAWNTLDLDFILEDFPGLLAESVGGADRIAHIVANLKSFSSIDIADQAPIDLNDCVRAVAGIVRGQLPVQLTLEIDTQPLPHIVCDQSRMNQVLFSLVQNARQALGDQGTIRIATRAVGAEVQVAVTDNGKGIAPDVLPRIFDPFFTTHDVGKGMGLGLTVSRDVVAAHQGRIEVESTVGEGSRFTVCLPMDARPDRSDALKTSL